MAHQIPKKVQAAVYFERWTLHDKKSMFRASDPPQYFLQIMVQVSGRSVVAREFIFDNRKARDDHYKYLKPMFGM